MNPFAKGARAAEYDRLRKLPVRELCDEALNASIFRGLWVGFVLGAGTVGLLWLIVHFA